jgi:hypothetical protein
MTNYFSFYNSSKGLIYTTIASIYPHIFDYIYAVRNTLLRCWLDLLLKCLCLEPKLFNLGSSNLGPSGFPSKNTLIIALTHSYTTYKNATTYIYILLYLVRLSK